MGHQGTASKRWHWGQNTLRRRPLRQHDRASGLTWFSSPTARKECYAHVPDAGRLRRGGLLGEQADRGCRHVGRGFVGLVPGGPVNTADADLELDSVRQSLRRPAESGERAVHGGLVHSRTPCTGYFRTAARWLDHPRGERRGHAAARRRRSRPPPTRKSRRSAPSRSTASTDTVQVEVSRGADARKARTASRPTSSR